METALIHQDTIKDNDAAEQGHIKDRIRQAGGSDAGGEQDRQKQALAEQYATLREPGRPFLR